MTRQRIYPLGRISGTHFPFIFVQSPMYIAPIAAFLRPGKVRQAILNFLGTFGLFGGLAVMIYAQPVFITTIGINIQTMVHHGAQVVLGSFPHH